MPMPIRTSSRSVGAGEGETALRGECDGVIGGILTVDVEDKAICRRHGSTRARMMSGSRYERAKYVGPVTEGRARFMRAMMQVETAQSFNVSEIPPSWKDTCAT